MLYLDSTVSRDLSTAAHNVTNATGIYQTAITITLEKFRIALGIGRIQLSTMYLYISCTLSSLDRMRGIKCTLH